MVHLSSPFSHCILRTLILSLSLHTFLSSAVGTDYVHRRHFPGPDAHGSDLHSAFSENPSIGLANAGLNKRQEYSCGPGRPCSNGACCGPTGWCNYGPEACGEGCTSNCDAHAECGKYALTPGKKCPLNVCCSEFGFCGTTEEFCKEPGCQSNCGDVKRPKGKGDTQARMIGYYEGWAHNKETCGKMTPEDIPASALTHLNFAFAYVKPSTYDIVVMDDLPTDLWDRTTELKQQNPGLEVWISVGGWTFNDNNTIWQPVFSEIASTKANRAKFIKNSIDFMTEYGFDGMDLDWEYPGAPDRGGHDADRKNYVSLLSEMNSAFKSSSRKKFGLSFTSPTSYWYLRWFDLEEIPKYVDFINVMSYDLHGVWDAGNPIGAQVLAHTNITEIGLALDLFWRNNVPASKLSIGMGFYGRSFQLKDPGCTHPGCPFSGPGAKGPCTGAAGILSYEEIQEVIKNSGGAKPYYDKSAQINYLVWNPGQLTVGDGGESSMTKRDTDSGAEGGGAQWISYDDDKTFKAKRDFANSLGLSGTLLWAIDQDDSKFTALKSVTGQDVISNPRRTNKAVASDLGQFLPSNCFKTTECNSRCPIGYTTLTDKLYLTPGRNDRCLRSYCCPSYASPDPKDCRWRGSPSECNGQCHEGEIRMMGDDQGDNKSKCVSGGVAFCCSIINPDLVKKCARGVCGHDTCTTDKPKRVSYVYDDNDVCISGAGNKMAWSYCCADETPFENCKWKGDGNDCTKAVCGDNQVEILRSKRGDRKNKCFWGRQRVLCCDVTQTGFTPLMPAKLENLFPSIPNDDTLLPSFATKIQDADYGTRTDPNSRGFAWVVIVGKKEAVTTFHKRDGSHIELFDCPVSRPGDTGLHVAKAVCMGDISNCEEIFEGGVEGTIVKMPDHCTGDPYVRAVYFRKADIQLVPHHLRKRDGMTPTSHVFEFGFDYDFSLRKRDFGEVLVRVDYSTMPGYWDRIVKDAPVTKRSNEKRSFENFRELDKRFWSTNKQEWKNRLLNIEEEFKASHSTRFTLDQPLYSAKKECQLTETAKFEASVDVELSGHLDVRNELGVTLIGKFSGFSISFAESYAFLHQEITGDVDINIAAMAKVDFNRYNIEQQRFKFSDLGGGINIKGMLELGPYLEVAGKMSGSATISGTVNYGAHLDIKELQYFFPTDMGQPDKGQMSSPGVSPRFIADKKVEVAAGGEFAVTVTPILGIELTLASLPSGKQEPLANAKIEVSLECTVKAKVQVDSSCNGISFGLDAGFRGDLMIESNVSGWSSFLAPYNFWKTNKEVIKYSCYKWDSAGSKKRGLDSSKAQKLAARSTIEARDGRAHLAKRASDHSALAVFKDAAAKCIVCPKVDASDPSYESCLVALPEWWRSGDGAGQSDTAPVMRRSEHTSNARRDLNFWTSPHPHISTTFSTDRSKTFCAVDQMPTTWSPGKYFSWSYLPYTTSVFDIAVDNDCTDYTLAKTPFTSTYPDKTAPLWYNKYAAEHILELQTLNQFYDWARQNNLAFLTNQCPYFVRWWARNPTTPFERQALQYSGISTCALYTFPNDISGAENNVDEFVILRDELNKMKENLFSSHGTIAMSDRFMTTLTTYQQLRVLKNLVLVYAYMNHDETHKNWKAQTARVGECLDTLDGNTGLIARAFNNPQTQPPQAYTSMGLKHSWDLYVASVRTEFHTRAMNFFEDKLQDMVDEYGEYGSSDDNATNGPIRLAIAALRAEYDQLALRV